MVSPTDRPSHGFWDSSRLVSPRAASCSPSWPPASCPHSPRERTRTEHLCFSLCCFCLFLIFFNPYSLTADVLVLTRDYLFIKYVQESAPVLAPPSKVGCACPARAEVEGDFSASESGRGGERKGLRGIETSKDVSKYLQVPRQKNISTVLSWG